MLHKSNSEAGLIQKERSIILVIYSPNKVVLESLYTLYQAPMQFV